MASRLNSPAVTKKLVENLQNDLRTLSSECKRKYPPVKEAAESGLLKIRNVTSKSDNIIAGMVACSADLMQPFILGCDTKSPKIVHLCLTAMQRLIQHEAVSKSSAENVISALWLLMEAGVEELKLLQTAILLLTTNPLVTHEPLARSLVLCFRLHFTKDSTTINTAAATVRQLVAVVFERVGAEDKTPGPDSLPPLNVESLKAASRHPPASLRPCAADAYQLFQDLCLLVNAEQPLWLIGMTEMTRTFCLELMESVLTAFPQSFLQHPEFRFLLKERVCPLVIKLFSPSLKYRSGQPQPAPPSGGDKPYFPIVMRLLRIVAVLLKHYYTVLVTECEIFLSLLVKFIDPEKPMWQRATAMEVLCKLCAQPPLLRSFCESYDMKPHSTKIFQDIVNGIGAFIQSQFVVSSQQKTAETVKATDLQGQPPSLVAGMPVGGGVTPQAAFYFRGVWMPIVVNITTTHKPIFLELLDRIEPPVIAEGYGLSLAFLCLLDVARCVQTVVDDTQFAAQAQKEDAESASSRKVAAEHAKCLTETLITSSWCGMMAAMSLLLDASIDESATESILKVEQIYASLCGRLALTTPRDAFITALCKASLPPHYTLTILNTDAKSTGASSPRGPSMAQPRPPDTMHEAVQGNQVVAVGTPLPTASLPIGAHQGPVMLTARNIQCMRAILGLAHCHGSVLGSAWHQILTTLQHLVWILGLKPAAGGSLRVSQQAADSPNAVITTAVMADLPVLSSMLSRLFESSEFLDDVALHHLIDALCKLSSEAMELAYTNREPSLFAVAKLLETGLVNLPRVEVLWRPVTAHLLEVCQHPHQAMRTWGAEAVTALTKGALQHKYEPPLHLNTRLQSLLLAPLQELSAVVHADIRQQQLQCVLQLLHSVGDSLHHGWPTVLGVIGQISNQQGEGLIRTAFQSLQLVVTDFLPIMPCTCLQVVVEVASKFGIQHQDLNISLTAIGLLWNIADYVSQHQQRISADLSHAAAGSPRNDSSGSGGVAAADTLWMCVFLRLGDLCTDPRPPVRKSAGQTLFSTVSAHGSLLQQATWQTVLWKVLFPLLDSVQHLSREASTTRDQTAQGNILMHHSRDTAEKQWAETRVLTLGGVARVFNMKRAVLQDLGDFPRAWALLLEYIEASALCQNAEVSLAALKSFQEILNLGAKDSGDGGIMDSLLPDDKDTTATDVSAPGEESMQRSTQNEALANGRARSGSMKAAVSQSEQLPVDALPQDSALWGVAWKVWLSIGTAVTTPPDIPPGSERTHIYIPTQTFLTALMHIFPALYKHIRAKFVPTELHKLFAVLQRALAVPVEGANTPFIVPVGVADISLTPLQEAVLSAIGTLLKDVLAGTDNMPTMYSPLFDHLLIFAEYSVRPPKYGKVDAKSVNNINSGKPVEWISLNFVPFAEGVTELVVELYRASCRHSAVINSNVLKSIIKTLRLPLGLKYGCTSQSTWMQAINSLLSVLSIGLPIARKHDAAFQGMWVELGHTLEDFLFSQHPPPPTLSMEDYQRDEALDCKVVQLLRDDILVHAQHVPREFVVTVMNILNKGSIHSANSAAFVDTDSSRKLREEFAKACFETLLQFSFITQQQQQQQSESAAPGEDGSITRLAVTALLHRCKDVLHRYIDDERLSGKCPLPRTRMSEMSFVLKAVGTLLVTLRKAPPNNVEGGIWQQVIELYPALVDCTTSTCPQVCRALKEALQEYRHLLAPPTAITNGL